MMLRSPSEVKKQAYRQYLKWAEDRRAKRPRFEVSEVEMLALTHLDMPHRVWPPNGNAIFGMPIDVVENNEDEELIEAYLLNHLVKPE